MVIKLSYFDARGIGEPIRMILAYGGEEFEDIRAPMSLPPTLPAEIKNKATWGSVPFIEFEGKQLGQSLAMTRFFARRHNLVPSNEFHVALCDEYVEAIRDFFTMLVPCGIEQDPAKKKEKVAELVPKAKQKFLTVFNAKVEGNGGKYLVGNSLTWADIYVAHVIEACEILTGVSLLADFPALKSHSTNVFSVPRIKAWKDKRPKTAF